MLSRTANNLYWMSRYWERATSTARLIDACSHSCSGEDLEGQGILNLPLRVQGVTEDFFHLGHQINIREVGHFFLWESHGASVKDCLMLARENARSERNRLSTEVWESINQTWLDLPHKQNLSVEEFSEWLQERFFVFQGAVHITMPKTLGRFFVRLGSFVERADQTLRILDVHSSLSTISDRSDFYHWNVLLRAVSALEAYQETYGDIPDRTKVLQLLIFNRAIPRSLRYCSERIKNQIESIGGANRSALKMSSQWLNRLEFDDYSSLQHDGVDSYLKQLNRDLSQLTLSIHQSYLEVL